MGIYYDTQVNQFWKKSENYTWFYKQSATNAKAKREQIWKNVTKWKKKRLEDEDSMIGEPILL